MDGYSIPPAGAAGSVKWDSDVWSGQVQSRAQLAKAAKLVEDSNILGSENELTFVLDPATRRTVVKVINRDTREVIAQLPPERVLQMAEQLLKRG